MPWIRDFINHFRTSTNTDFGARRAGYVTDQIGIMHRYQRESAQWQSHLNNTKRFVLNAAEKTESHDSLAVLGSGWLLDLPIDELAPMFKQITLFDIVHPQLTQHAVKKYSNVVLQTADLTGGLVKLATECNSFAEFVEQMQYAEFPNLSSFSFVVSLNLLNQLDIILCDYLTKRFGLFDKELIPIRKFVQQRHVDSLPRCSSCLVADYQEINTDIETKQQTIHDSIYATLPITLEREEWLWNFDTNQRYNSHQNTQFKVMALRF